MSFSKTQGTSKSDPLSSRDKYKFGIIESEHKKITMKIYKKKSEIQKQGNRKTILDSSDHFRAIVQHSQTILLYNGVLSY